MKQTNTALIETDHPHDQNYKCEIKKAPENKKNQKLYSLPFNFEKVADEALVSLYVNNKNEDAFNQIVERYNDIIFGFAMKLLRNTQDAEEVNQDVFLILATKLHTFKGNSKFSTWLYRVSLNTCYKYLNDTKKRSNKEIHLEESYVNQSQPLKQWHKRPDELALYKERVNLINTAVNELNESNKKIFNLKDIIGYSNAEVGESMGLSISAVKSRVLRTRLSLKEKMSGYFETA